jgi:transposase
VRVHLAGVLNFLEAVLYLPPYSPDLNFIEEAFSKLKHILRKIGARGKEALIDAIGGV